MTKKSIVPQQQTTPALPDSKNNADNAKDGGNAPVDKSIKEDAAKDGGASGTAQNGVEPDIDSLEVIDNHKVAPPKNQPEVSIKRGLSIVAVEAREL